MLQFFGASGGAQKFDSTPIAGKPSIAIGSGTFGGGAAPDFQGTVALGVNMSAGYGDYLCSLQIAGVQKFGVDSTGGAHFTDLFNTDGSARFYTGNAGSFYVLGSTANNTPLYVQGVALQTADLYRIQDSAGVGQFCVANIGTGVSPVWAIRVAPTANTESMVQTHVGGASTGKAIQVIDNTGTSLGWLQLLA